MDDDAVDGEKLLAIDSSTAGRPAEEAVAARGKSDWGRSDNSRSGISGVSQGQTSGDQEGSM